MIKRKSAKFWLDGTLAQEEMVKAHMRSMVVERSGRKRKIRFPIELNPGQVLFALDLSEVLVSGFGSFRVFKTGSIPFKASCVAGLTEMGFKSGRVWLRVWFVPKKMRARYF